MAELITPVKVSVTDKLAVYVTQTSVRTMTVELRCQGAGYYKRLIVSPSTFNLLLEKSKKITSLARYVEKYAANEDGKKVYNAVNLQLDANKAVNIYGVNANAFVCIEVFKKDPAMAALSFPLDIPSWMKLVQHGPEVQTAIKDFVVKSQPSKIAFSLSGTTEDQCVSQYKWVSISPDQSESESGTFWFYDKAMAYDEGESVRPPGWELHIFERYIHAPSPEQIRNAVLGVLKRAKLFKDGVKSDEFETIVVREGNSIVAGVNPYSVYGLCAELHHRLKLPRPDLGRMMQERISESDLQMIKDVLVYPYKVGNSLPSELIHLTRHVVDATGGGFC